LANTLKIAPTIENHGGMDDSGSLEMTIKDIDNSMQPLN